MTINIYHRNGAFISIITLFVLLIVALAPLPFGSNRPESWNLISLFVGVLALASLVTISKGKKNRSLLRKLIIPACLVLLTLAFIVVQSSSLFPVMHTPLWPQMSLIISDSNISSISVNPTLTLSNLTLYFCYISIFWLAVITSTSNEATWKQLGFILFIGSFYSVYGIIVFFSGNNYILWFPKWAYWGDLTSVFVNRNSFATYAGLIVVCNLALLIKEFKRLDTRNIRNFLQANSQQTIRIYLLSLALLTNLTAIFLTHSRGGFLATAIGIFALFLITLIKKRQNTKYTLGVAVIFFLSLLWFVTTLSGDATFFRLSNTTLDSSVRDEVYLLVIEGIKASPFLGWGYGTFEESFRAFYSDQVGGVNWDKAHNTYLEIMFELGLVFGILFFAPLFLVSLQLIKGVIRRKTEYLIPAIGIASLALSAAHALVDFSHQIPAIAILFAWILGITFAHCLPGRRRSESREQARK